MKVPTLRTRSNAGSISPVGTTATAENFGAGDARAIGQIGSAAAKIAANEYNSFNIAAVQEAESGMYEWENNALYGDDGLYKQKGKNSLGASDKLIGDYDAYTSEVMGTLTNESQKKAFKQSSDARRKSLMGLSSKYQFGEMQNYKTEQGNAYVKNSQTSAINNYNDPELVDLEVNKQVDSIRATANANGTSPEQTKLLIENTVSNTYSGVVGQYLSNENYSGARDYYEKNKGRIVPAQRDQIEKMLKTGDVRGQSQNHADEIMTMGLSKTDALKKAREVSNPEVRDSVVQRVKARYAEQDKVVIANDKRASEEAYTQILNGNEIDIVGAQNLNDATKESLATYQSNLQQGIATETSPTSKATLDFLYVDHPEQFMQTNLLQYRSSLGDSDYDVYVKLQQELINPVNEGKSFDPKSTLFTPKSYTTKAAQEFGIYDPRKTSQKQSDDYKEYYAQFSEHVDNKLIEAQQEKGDQLTWLEQKNVIDNEAAFWKTQVKQRRSLWTDKGDILTGTLTDEDLKAGDFYVDVPGIPKDISVQLTEYLIQNKIPPTEENVQYAFQQGKYK